MIAQTNHLIDEDLQRAKDLRMKYDIKLNKLRKKDNLICPSISIGMNKTNFSLQNKKMNVTNNTNFFSKRQTTPPKKLIMTALEDPLTLSPLQPKGRPSVGASIFKTQYRLERINSSNFNSALSSAKKNYKLKKHTESLRIESDMKREFNNLLSASSAKNILQKMEKRDSKFKQEQGESNNKLYKNSQFNNYINNANIIPNEQIINPEIDLKSEGENSNNVIIDSPNSSNLFNIDNNNFNHNLNIDFQKKGAQNLFQKPEIIAGKNVFKNPNEDKSTMRKKSYKVKYEPDWYLRAKVPEIKLPKKIAEDMQLQFHLIDDELKVISENMHYFKSTCLNNSNLLRAFSSLDLNQQMKLNILIEETCGLMLEVANRILADFSQFLEKFLSMQPPHPTKISSKYVKFEDKTFIFNAGVFNEISAFLKSCHDVYSTLVKQVDDLIIPFKDLQIILQFLTRIRLNLSNLLFSCKGHMKNFKFDSNLVEIFSEKSKEDELEGNLAQQYDRKNKINEFRNNRKDIIDKIKNSFSFKKNEYNERMRRLNNVLFV
jgi:hypothetical protein